MLRTRCFNCSISSSRLHRSRFTSCSRHSRTVQGRTRTQRNELRGMVDCFMGKNKWSIALDELKEFDFLTHWFLNVVNNHRVFFQVMNLFVLLYVYLFFGWYSCCLWPNWSKCSWFIFFCTTSISVWLMFSAAWHLSMQIFISNITLSRCICCLVSALPVPRCNTSFMNFVATYGC